MQKINLQRGNTAVTLVKKNGIPKGTVVNFITYYDDTDTYEFRYGYCCGSPHAEYSDTEFEVSNK